MVHFSLIHKIPLLYNICVYNITNIARFTVNLLLNCNVHLFSDAQLAKL